MIQKPTLNDSAAITDNESQFIHTTNGLVIEGKPTFQQCCDELTNLKIIARINSFWIGDLLNYMDITFGESYAQAVDHFDYAVGSLANMKSVARAFPASRRRERIPYSYYQAIQGLEEADQDKLLDQIESGQVSRLYEIRMKASIMKKHSMHIRKECEHDLMTVCKKCGKVIHD